MATLDMLNVAIGMIFIYLLLSLIATAINEIIENLLKNRASNLKRGIQELIAPSEEDSKLLKNFYEHPLICSLYKGSFEKNKNLPSYIPSSGFTSVLLHLILTGEHKAQAQQDTVSQPTFSINVYSVKAALEQWPYAHSRNALSTLLADAEGDMEKFRGSIENWFNNSMDRVSGWYKKKIQLFLVIIGFCLALAFNADSIALFKSLVKDAPLRNSLVTASQEFAKSNDTVHVTNASTRFNENLKRVNNLRLPLGWDWREKNNDISVSNYSLAIPTDEGKGIEWNWVAKIAGLLLTGIAISLGAPFWFDMLNKIMIVRSAIKPQEKSKEALAKDKVK